MSVFVKICGLTDAADVSAAIEAGADALGFVFAESPRRVNAEHAAAITAGVPAGVLRVAVMLHPSREEWRTVASVFRPDVLQADADDFAELDVPAGVVSWPVYREGAERSRAGTRGVFVYEGRRSGRGETVDWGRAATLAGKGRMILAGGLGPDNVTEAVRAVGPYGVDASSALESAPGRKDRDRMAAYVAAAKSVTTG